MFTVTFDIRRIPGPEPALEDPDSPWGIRGVDVDVRQRIKVLASIRHQNVGQIVDSVLKYWLREGAPDVTRDAAHNDADERTPLCQSCAGQIIALLESRIAA